MSYSLDFDAPVRAYLQRLGLTRSEAVRLYANLHTQLAAVSDVFRNDPSNRLVLGGPEFVWILAMFADDGRPLVFRFVVDDSAALYGVLRLVYVDVS